MSRRADELHTTSFAMLGMLAIRPWSTYELAKHVDRSLGPLWPRARSHLFNEPKKLAANGLATASEEMVGRRPRTVYTITPAGRRALRRWLATPGEGPVLEFEQLLKVFFADHGTKADALQAIDNIRAWAQHRTEENIAVARSYPWADSAADAIDTWPDDPSRAQPDWAFMKQLSRRDATSPSSQRNRS